MNRFLDREKKIFRFNINFFYLFVLVLSSAFLIFFNINISNRVNDLQFHKIPVLNNGKNLFQFVDSKDFLSACLLSEKLNGYYKFNIGSKKIFSINEVIYELISHANSKSKVVSLPKFITLFSIKMFLIKLKVEPLPFVPAI